LAPALDTGGAISQYGVMRHVSHAKLAALAGSILLIAFVIYRARTFHYCAGYETLSSHVSIISADQSCGAGEESAAFQALWRREGLRAKFKTTGQTIVHAFIP